VTSALMIEHPAASSASTSKTTALLRARDRGSGTLMH
jgi:hypothetical protein